MDGGMDGWSSSRTGVPKRKLYLCILQILHILLKEFEGFLASSSGDRLQSFKTTKFPSFLKAGANPVHLLFESMLESCHEALEVRTDVFDACPKRMNMQK
ncbi:hypothetical protein E2320_013020, partial [Naja naja]